jgi:hypothetical protein
MQQSAWNVRRRLVEAMTKPAREHETLDGVGCALDKMLEWAAGDDTRTAVAVLDLELRHRACSKPYAELLGVDPAMVRGTLLPNLVADADRLYAGLERLLTAEVDYRSFEVDARPAPAPMVVHCAMARRPDATPWGIVVVAHGVVRA